MIQVIPSPNSAMTRRDGRRAVNRRATRTRERRLLRRIPQPREFWTMFRVQPDNLSRVNGRGFVPSISATDKAPRAWRTPLPFQLPELLANALKFFARSHAVRASLSRERSPAPVPSEPAFFA